MEPIAKCLMMCPMLHTLRSPQLRPALQHFLWTLSSLQPCSPAAATCTQPSLVRCCLSCCAGCVCIDQGAHDRQGHAAWQQRPTHAVVPRGEGRGGAETGVGERCTLGYRWLPGPRSYRAASGCWSQRTRKGTVQRVSFNRFTMVAVYRGKGQGGEMLCQPMPHRVLTAATGSMWTV